MSKNKKDISPQIPSNKPTKDAKELTEEEEERKYKEELEREEQEEKERNRQELEEKRKEKERSWTIEQEYFERGLSEWADFYIQYDRYRLIDRYTEDEKIMNEILRKDIEKVEQFINYKVNNIYEKWACTKNEEKDNDENTQSIRNEIECIRAYFSYHQKLFDQFFKTELENVYNTLLPKINNMIKNEDQRIQELEETFKATTRAKDRITSQSTQQIEEYTESDDYLKEREKYVFNQHSLVQENKRYSNIQLGFIFLIPVILNYNIALQAISNEILPFYRAFYLITLQNTQSQKLSNFLINVFLYFSNRYLTCFSICLWIWSANKINYKVIFETPYQKENPVFWTSIFNIILMIGCFFSIFDQGFLEHQKVREYCIYLMLLQFILGYRFLVGKFFRAVIDPLKFLVEFKSNFFFDQICSLTVFMQDIDYYICYEFMNKGSSYCSDKKILYKGLLFGAIPIAWRLFQSFIMIFTTHKNISFFYKPSVYNCIKFSSVLYTMYVTYMKQFDTYYQDKWLQAITISTTLTYLWDVYQDWGLLRIQHFFLREKMLYKNPMYYVLAIILNFCFRFSWVVANNNHLKNKLYISSLNPFEQVTLFASIEIIRRNIWNIFLLEKLQVDLINSNKVVVHLKGVKMDINNAQNSKDVDVKKIITNYNKIAKKVSQKELQQSVDDIKSLYKQHSKKTKRVKSE